MAQMMDHIDYLSKEIGPRPAGTEEEQQAALYITEQFQKESGFSANIEEFSSSSNLEIAQAVLALVTVIVTILAIIFPVLAIPAFVLAAAAAAIYALEAFDNPIISRFLSRGASQNVVAKYQPNYDEATGRRSRSRKVIVMAHYDTGRVTPPLVNMIDSLPVPVGLSCVIGMIAAAFFLLIRIFIAPGGGMGLLILNVLSILAIIVCLVPVLKGIMMRIAPYNEGANNNASGTAALIEVARRISRGSVSEAELAHDTRDDVYIHGEEAAREAGLVPEGAQIRYEAEQLVPPSELGNYDDDERLLAAKAAIAALTGVPVERRVYGSVADNLVNPRSADSEQAQEGADYGQIGDSYGQGNAAQASYGDVPSATQSELSSEAEAVADDAAEGYENAPDWFVAAQQNARKTESDPSTSAPIYRSKYTEAFDYAERERLAREEQIRAEEEARRAAEEERRAAEEARQRAMAEAEERRRLREEEARREQEAAAAAEAMKAEPDVEQSLSQDTMAFGMIDVNAEVVPEIKAQEQAADQLAIPEIGEATPDSGRHARVAALPSIQTETTPEPTTSPSRSGILRNLRNNVPSLSGLINPVEEAPAQPKRRASAQDIPSVIEAPEVAVAPEPQRRVQVPDVEQAPVEAPVVAPAVVEEPVDYNMEFSREETEVAAERVPEPEVSAVPRSRSGSLLSRLRREKKEEALSDTPQEWLDVDEDFEARNVGRARGSWESFRDDQYFDDDDRNTDTFGTGDEERPRRRWEGGSYSRAQIGRVDMRSGEDSEADMPITEQTEEVVEQSSLTGEIEQIYHFRNPQFNNEIWFVAVGSDGLGHNGAKAFIEEHRDELRGSMIIEVESLGAGALSVATEEGDVRKVTASSRVKRFTRKATAATGIALDEVSLVGSDSIASTIQKAGYQAMHLFGAENGRPALKGSADDVSENVDDLLLDENVNYLFELLKQ